MSKRIEWSDSIRTGNHYIDLQHQELIELINALADSVAAADAPEQVTVALKQLELYVLFHFNTEENLMANSRISTEHTRRHMDAHHAFATRLQAFKQAAPDSVALQTLVDFLVSWLTGHIMQTDQELARLLRA